MSKSQNVENKIPKNKNVESKCRKLEYEYVSGLEINVWKIVQYFGWHKWDSGWCKGETSYFDTLKYDKVQKYLKVP